MQTLGATIIGNSVYSICSLPISLGALKRTHVFLSGFRATRSCCMRYCKRRDEGDGGRRTGMGATQLCVSRFVRILGLTIVHVRVGRSRGTLCNLPMSGFDMPSLDDRTSLTR